MDQFNVRPIDYSSIEKEFYVFIKSNPCKITNVSHTKTGKHGAMKVVLIGIDVLTNKKYECSGAGHKQTKQFDIVRTVLHILQVPSLEDERITHLNEKSDQTVCPLSANNPMFSEIKKYLDSNNEKDDVYVTILFAPIEKSEGGFNIGHIIENCKHAL